MDLVQNVPLSVSCHVTVLTLGGFNSRSFSCNCGTWKSKMEVLSDLVSDKSSLVLQMAAFVLCPQWCFLRYTGLFLWSHWFHHGCPTPMTSANPTSHPKTPSPKTITQGVVASMYEFGWGWGCDTNAQSITVNINIRWVTSFRLLLKCHLIQELPYDHITQKRNTSQHTLIISPCPTFLFFSSVRRMGPRASHVLGKCPTTESHPSSTFFSVAL